MNPPFPNPPPVSEPIVYRIDAANRVVWVNEAWSEFAAANHGELVLPPRILGRDLLAAFADHTARELYGSLIRHVREGRVVRFDFRCDAPDRRRTFRMEIRPLPGGVVEFVSTLCHEEERAPLTLLQPAVPRDRADLIRLCSWCQCVPLPDGSWQPVEEAVATLGLLASAALPAITHTICPGCHDRMRAMLNAAGGGGGPGRRGG